MKTIPIFVFFSLACCVSVTYSCASSSNSSKNLYYLDEDSTNLQQNSSNGEAEALAAWNRLMDTLGCSRNVSDSIEYPDYYGGSYIDKGELVVLSPIRFLGKDNYDAVLGRGNYRLEGCDYSYKELVNVMSIIDKYKLENKESSVSNNFYSYEISEKDNRVIVYLQEYSDEAIASFKNEVINSPIIEFLRALGVPVYWSAIVYPGESIQPVNGAPETAGYRAKYVTGNTGKSAAAGLTKMLGDEGMEL